jgi:sugar lactone lactonase YvrE
MGRITTGLAVAAAAAGLALLAVGCSGTAAKSPGTNASPAGAVSRALPSPFTITAHYSAKSLGLDHPDAMAVGPDGNLYVTDLSQRVTVVSRAGTVLRRFGKPGSGAGEFRFIPGDPTVPTDVFGKIAVGPDGLVYVADSGNARVQVLTPQGRFVRQFGSFGSGKDQFLFSGDIAVDNAGDVYVADGQSATLAKLYPAGKVVWQIGGGASSDQDLSGCCFNFTGFDAHGRLVIVNDSQKRVLYVDQSGHKVDAFTPDAAAFAFGNVCEVTVDATGNTYVSGCGPDPTGPTLVYDLAHRLIAKWPGTTYSLFRSPVFGPPGEVFALATDGTILKLRITLPGA